MYVTINYNQGSYIHTFPTCAYIYIDMPFILNHFFDNTNERDITVKIE
jgi:hypothetical protein